ncbi:unnamed protein product [Adineta steineri]|uniref:SEA domain-containing protein n=1 Tax=Adineta steineri TaxID=433720 RepID=A0A815NH33_9BILA|nr:unnamed protein product [Adineta steineri]
MIINGDSDANSTLEQNGTVSYIKLDEHSTLNTYSSTVLSNYSADDENDDHHDLPKFIWKRQKIFDNNCINPERLPNDNNVLKNLHIDQNLIMLTKENGTYSYDDELQSLPSRSVPSIPEDKLHRRNPHTVRQELKMFDDFAPETDLSDIHLNEMPGLHNTDQWKRIAGRTFHSSPPLSRQYYQTITSTLELQDGQVPQPLGSYRRPGRSPNEPFNSEIAKSTCRLPRRRILFGSFIAVVIIAIVVSVILAVMIVPKPSTTTTVFYEGRVHVIAQFNKSLLDLSSTLAKSYQGEFCSLIGTTLADTRTKYAAFYSTCTVTSFHHGSIIANFVLGFTRYQNVTRLNYFLNRTLVNKQLFGGTISSIRFNLTLYNSNSTYPNSTDYYDEDNSDFAADTEKIIMTEQNSTNELQQQQQQQTAHTSYTTVTYTTLETGLSITISETITITNNNNNLEKSPINNKNYELILIPTIENGKTVAVPTGNGNEKPPLPPASSSSSSSPPPPTPPAQSPPPLTTASSNIAPTKTSSQLNLIRPLKKFGDTNFAYIDASSDDPTYSSGDGININVSLFSSTLGDLTTRDSTSTASTVSLDNGTITDSTSTLADNFILPTPSNTTTKGTTNRPSTTTRPPVKTKNESSEEKKPSRPNSNVIKRQRRMIVPKTQRRLLQYELMPTGKVYYVDRPIYNENQNFHYDNDDNSSTILSTILSRSSSVDTLSDKRYRHHHHHQQQNRKYYHDLSLKKNEQKLSVGGRLASNHNLPTTTTISSFKPINTNTKKNRFSSFEPTRESLDQVFDVLIAADKRREENDFWREKFEQRTPISRAQIVNNRIQHAANTNTMPFFRSKQTQPSPNSILNHNDNRSQSYTNKRTSLYEATNRQNGNLLEDCLRRRTQIVQQQPPQQQQQLPPPITERNYSPNTIYSTNYPKHQLPPTGKPPLPTTTTTTHQPVRILPLSNGRLGRAPQARQTSDDLSSTSDVWAARSSIEDETRPTKKSSLHARFPSAINRPRTNEPKNLNNKRALSVGQQKPNRTQNKNLLTTSATTTKSKFFDLFKFNR